MYLMPFVYSVPGRQNALRSLGRAFTAVFRRKGGGSRSVRAICGLIQLPRSLEMAKRTKTLTYTSEEFEAKAKDLMHVVFTMSEERIFADPGQRSCIGNALAEGAMTLNYALRIFLAVYRMHDK